MGNPLLALQVQPSTIDLAGSYGRGQELQTQRLGNMLQQYKMAQAQRADQQANALSALNRQIGPGLAAGDPGAINQLAAVDPAGAMGYREKAADIAGKTDANAKSEYDLQRAKADHVASVMSAVIQAPDPAKPMAYQWARQQLANNGSDISKMPQTYTPDILPQLQATAQAAMSVKDQLDNKQKQQTIDETGRHNTATESNAKNVLAETTRKDSADIAAKEAAGLDDSTISQMADQYIAGDKSVMQNLGRGVQGASNIVKLRGAIANKLTAKGMTGADMAQAMAEFQGLTSGERALGTRTANIGMAVNEAKQVIPLALEASKAVSRSQFLPLAQAENAVKSGTNDPNLRRFVAANNTLINVYARAINPTGTPTESDKAHAREMLSTAFDQPSYEAVVDQMNKEMQAASSSPAATREDFRHGTEKDRTNTALPDNATGKGATTKTGATVSDWPGAH